jgi:hypothetical protein
MLFKVKRLIIMALSLSLFGCGEEKGVIDVAEDFEPYYQRFISNSIRERADMTHKSISIKFIENIDSKDPALTVLGTCIPDSNKIEINKDAWKSLQIPRREALIFHELGHCLLHRGHDDSIDPVLKKPLSLMNSYLIGSFDFTNRYEYYAKELFLNPKEKDVRLFHSGTSLYKYPELSEEIRDFSHVEEFNDSYTKIIID